MQCWPHTVEASCCICRSFQVHVLQWRFKKIFEGIVKRGQAVTVEIFAVSFFVYVNGNPVFARFRVWVGVANQGKGWHDAGRHSVSGIGAQEVGSQQTFEDLGLSVGRPCSGRKVEKDVSVLVDFYEIVEFCVHHDVDRCGQGRGKFNF